MQDPHFHHITNTEDDFDVFIRMNKNIRGAGLQGAQTNFRAGIG